jgi:sulfur carrier protein ThiS
MHRNQLPFRVAALLAVVLIVAACAPRAGGGETLLLPGAEDLTLDLPSVIIDFDRDGVPSFADIPLADLGNEFAPGMLDTLAVPASTVQFLVDKGIQHIQISNDPSGLLVLVNGRAIPSLKWGNGELANTAKAIDLLGVELGPGTAVVEELLPLITHLGVGVITRFPTAEGLAEIPFESEQSTDALVAVQQAQQSFLQTVNRAPTISVPIVYDAQGSWRVGDLTYAEWISLTGMPIFDSFRLRPEAIDSLIRSGVTEFAVSTDVDGIHVSINGQPLPYLGWADGELNNALALAEQAGVWDMLAAQNINVEDVLAMVDTILPVVQATEITITAHFPEALASVN